jgi:aarF domain-containing kinase
MHLHLMLMLSGAAALMASSSSSRALPSATLLRLRGGSSAGGGFVAALPWAGPNERRMRAPQALLDARRNMHFFMRSGHLFTSYKIFETRTNLWASLARHDREWVETQWSAQHDWGGQQIFNMACAMEGFHLKGAQWLGARPDIAPKEWVAHLSKLQDRCPAMPTSQVRDILQTELGEAAAKELEAEFESEPLGSASIAQVHRAKVARRGGLFGRLRHRDVAIKVQRPGAEQRMIGDVSNLRSFFSVGAVRKALAWDPMLILDQVEEETKQEFDFVGEAAIMDAARSTLARHRGWLRSLLSPVLSPLSRIVGGDGGAPPVQIPQSVPGLVTPRVLVMDLLPGTALSRFAKEAAEQQAAEGDEDAGGSGGSEQQEQQKQQLSSRERAAGKLVLRKLGRAYGQMLFDDTHGLVHADPHPGNILVTRKRGIFPDLNVGLIDWGQSRTYDLGMRLRLAALVDSLCAAGDAAGRMKSAAIIPRYHDLNIYWNCSLPIEKQRQKIAAAATDLFDTIPLPLGFSADPTSDTYHMAGLTGVEFPPELIYFFRATQIIRALTEQMGVDFSLAEEWRPHARRLLRRKGGDAANWAMA